MHDTSGQEAEGHAKHCEVCGQSFDTRDLDQVFHHDNKPHEPLPAKND